mmetsp:Transcript_18229/g.25896  ORF Transcript_18229/g.25896 Transcript_18229/m.25896 type:complete len:99 (+) Transcript_18229:606-902(+)
MTQPIALEYLNVKVAAADIVPAEADVRTLTVVAGAGLPCLFHFEYSFRPLLSYMTNYAAAPIHRRCAHFELWSRMASTYLMSETPSVEVETSHWFKYG